VIAERVRQLREARGLTAARLAERMTEEGVKWDRSVVANLENGRRASVTVEELFALAYVLEVAPVHLVIPLDADGWIHITPELSTTNEQARAWIRGTVALLGVDERKFYSEVPEGEFKRRADAQLEWEREMAEKGIISFGPAPEREGEQQ
jgi:transcriptional regulator with XRE-family HTH domain